MFETSMTWNDLLFMLQGASNTLLITFWAVAGGTLLGIGFGLVRATGPRWITFPLGSLLDVLRSVPLLIQFILANSFQAIAGLGASPFIVQ